MTRSFCVLLLLASCGVAQASLQTNFSASYGKYVTATSVQGSSKSFKLYFDPEGIVAGQVTAFVDVPTPGDFPRLDSVASLEDIHDGYIVTIQNTLLQTTPERQRTESTITFQARNALFPPLGDIVIFAYAIGDRVPLGTDDVFAGFEFKPGDFIDTIDSDTQLPQHYDFDDLQGVTIRQFQTPEPGACTLAAGALAALVRLKRRLRG